MKKRLIALIIISTLSLSLMVGCGESTDSGKDTTGTNTSEINNSDNNNSKTQTDSDTEVETTPEDNSENTSDSDATESINVSSEDYVKEKFTEVLTKLYNVDYSIPENKEASKEYARNSFSEEGYEEFLKNLNDYNSEITSSDLLITKVTEVKIDNSSYSKAYEIRYNVNIVDGKPSIYTDLIGVVWEDKSGNLFVNSINDKNF